MMDLQTFKSRLFGRPGSIPPAELRRFAKAIRRPPTAPVRGANPGSSAGEGAG